LSGQVPLNFKNLAKLEFTSAQKIKKAHKKLDCAEHIGVEGKSMN
jgi:hypothetical protein